MRKIVIYINEFPFNKEESSLYKKMILILLKYLIIV